MYSWSEIQLKKMEAGGNDKLNNFLSQYGCLKELISLLNDSFVNNLTSLVDRTTCNILKEKSVSSSGDFESGGINRSESLMKLKIQKKKVKVRK
ncbi:hypothetical protein AQUCO_01400838v1 [Aquilegia coerulea]|uniref:Uncharacterized protein n=1 Tax=Aquilegia coerulea TaxID=218851 RepID=A0A2G5DYC2_AQUCA|nr:hypothetical protein AQUCO_01400838v1 [Aquilegia coerulea]